MIQDQRTVEGFRLSPQQKRLWLHQESDGTYHTQSAFLAEGTLDRESLRLGFERAARRHEVFRTIFHRLAGMELPIQVVLDELPIAYAELDLPAADAAAWGEVAEELHCRDREAGLDLERGPLVRITVARLAGDRHLVCITTPSLCGDARTHANLLAEAGLFSAAIGAGSETAEPVQYVDFSEWQHELLASEEAIGGREFWRGQMADELAAPGLPFEAEPDAGTAFAVGSVRADLGPGVGARLEGLARGEGVAPEVVLAAAWLALLARLSRCSKLALGWQHSGRKYEDLAGAHGLFARFLPLRLRVEPGHRFVDLVAQIERSRHQAEEWLEYLCWDDLAAAVGPTHLRLPFCFECGGASSGLQLAGARLSLVRQRSLLERFTLLLRASISPEGLQLEIEHDARRVARDEARRLLERLCALLGRALDAPATNVFDLGLLGDEDRRRLAAFNDTTLPVGSRGPLHRRFEAQAARTPDAEAVVYGGARLTYGELNARANRLARYLLRRGARPGSRVVIALPRSGEQIVALLAAWKAGAAFVPVDPLQPAERSALILEDVTGDGTPAWLVTTAELAPRLSPAGLPAVELERTEEARAAESGEDLRVEVPVEAPAYLLFTSGSTGRPKGAVIRHSAVLNLDEALQRAVYAETATPAAALRVSVNAPLAFDASIKQVIQLLRGHALYLVPEDIRADGPALLSFLREHRLDVLDCTPAQLGILLAAGLLDEAGAPRLTLVGGEKIDALLWERLARQDERVFYNVYGPTECTVDATVERVGATPAPGIGRPIANVSAWVMDEFLQPLPPEVWGELLIGGAGVALGYAGRPDLTAERFVPDPCGPEPGARLYRTGDRVRLRADGSLEYLGRIDLQVKVRGHRVELGEIEAVLREHPGVAEAVVAAREDAPGDVRLAAYVVPRRRSAGVIEGRVRHELPNGMAVVEQNRNETEYLYQEIFAQRCYVRHGIELPDDACVFDVGANIGMFTLFVHQECARPRVYAFEPLEPIYEALRINCELYAPTARLFPVGLSDAERSERFTFYPRYTMMSGQSRYARPDSEVEVVKRYLQNQLSGGAAEASVLLESAEDLLEGRFEGQVIEARLRRLSDVLREAGVERIDLLKVDVQRAELDVLRGIDDADWARIDQMVMEVHDAPGQESEGRVAQILALLDGKGYAAVAEQDDLLAGTDRHNLYAVHRGLARRKRREERPRPDERELPRELTTAELRELLRRRLPEPMVPSSVVFLDRLPLNRNGKVDRAALPAPESLAAGRELERAGPRTPFEEVLAAIWREVLDLPQVGVDESFFDLGGHSLLATQLMSRIRAVLEIELPLRVLFEQPTVAGLARHVEAAFRAGGELATPPIEPLPRTGALPLSFAQQRLWFLHQLAPEDPTYNNSKVVAFQGSLEMAALAAALDEIVRRHEILRTCLPNVDGEPLQRISPPAPVPLPEIDLAELPVALRGAEARRLAQRESERPFDLAREVPLRVIVVRLGPEDRHVLFTLHHIANDAWSLGILSREVSALYQAFAAGRPSPLRELPIQYADYAAWQRSWLRGEVLERYLSFWRGRLAGLPPVLDLPTDRPRQAVRTHRGDRLTLAIPAALTERLDALGRSLGATRFMVLLTAFQALLARASGQEDLAVGTPIAGRDRLELEPLIGLFVNMLVMRGDLRGEPSFLEAVGRTREAALAAYAHQALPFETLVDALQPERSLSHAPLFQVMFALQNVSREELELPGLRAAAAAPESRVARFDVSLVAQEADGGLLAVLEYSTDLFDAVTVLRFAGAFERLLASFVGDPARALSQASPWTEAERWQVLGEWNDTDRELPGGAALHGLFEAQVSRSPEAEALLEVDAEGGASPLTYRELDGLANRIAHHLLALGLRAEARVGLCLERAPEVVTALLGVLKAGGAYVPLDPSFPRERLGLIAADAGLALLVTREALLDRLPESGAGVVCLDRDAAVIAVRPSTRPAVSCLPQSLAYVLYTSGSTGRPKGVAVPHGAAVNFLSSMRRCPGLASGETLLAVTTLSFDIAILELLLPLSVGARVALAGRDTSLDGARLVRALRSATAGVMQATPATWRLLLEAGWPGDERFRALCGGEALPADLAAALLARSGELWNLYGPTETTVWSALHRVTAPLAPAASLPLGRPVENTRIYLLDGRLAPVPVGAAGELYVGGAGVARGYLNRPDLTAERFLPEPFGAAGDRLYRVGDIGRQRADGTLEFLGRMDHQVKVRGFRIELGEIEAALVRHPGVAEAVAARSGDADARLVAYVTAVAAGGLDVSELRSFLQESLPGYMVPSAFVLLPALPRTPNGKVDRRALPAPEIAAGTGETVAPRTPVEELLAQIWAEVLGRERVGVEEDFFALGGHSLLAIRMMSRLRRALRVDLPLRALFEAPTVAGLAAAAERARRAEEAPQRPPLTRVARDGDLPLSYAQQRLWFLDQLEPDSPLYNLALTVRLQGNLDAAALERSLAEIVGRHEVLRTRFPVRAGRPVQEIAPAGGWLLPLVDLTGLDESRRHRELRDLAQAEAERPFDLARGPVFRTSLLRLAEREHVLVATVHHIASDAWSTDVIRRELGVLYRAILRGEAPALPKLPVQYADYGVWQRRWLEEGGRVAELEYWRQRLAGLPEVLELPLDRPRPAVRGVRGANHAFSLPGSLHESLRALGQRIGATPFMTLLAGFQALLGRYAGEDVAVGTPVAGRRHLELEGLIGFFVNTLVLRVDLAGDPPFIDIVERVREAVLDAYEHQDLPFDKLVEELQPERSLRHSPLFQVFFVFQPARAGEPELPELQASPLLEPSRIATAREDLTLLLTEQADALSALLNYRVDLFEMSTVARLAGHLRALLEGAVAGPGQRFSELPLLTAGERQQLREWNDTAAPGRPRWRRVHDMFREQARRQPAAVAVVQGSRRLTYGELDRWSDVVAWRLRSLDVGPEVRVGLCAERSFERVAGLLGILKAGGAVLPLDATHPAERLSFLLEDSDAGVVAIQPHLLARLPLGGRPPILLDGIESRGGAEEGPPVDGLLPENLAYVVYTSGSTGEPKASGILHLGLCNFAETAADTLGLGAGDGVLQFASPSFDSMLGETILALTSGATLCLGTAEILLPGPDLVSTLRDSGVTAMVLPPSVLAMLPEGELPMVRLVVSAGEACTPELRDRWSAGRRFFNAYGPSEATVTATWRLLYPGDGVDFGHPIQNVRLHLVDHRGSPVPVGVPGEICLAGAGLTRGYLNRPSLTAEKFVPDPFGGPGERLYRSGDLARRRPDGTMEFAGRIDHQVKVRGFRIELGEIETALAAQEGVRGAVVLARQNAPGGARLVAYVVPAAGRALRPGELRRLLSRRLPEHSIPAQFIFLEQLPLLANGKVDRKALSAAEIVFPEGDQEHVPPRNPVEEILASIWAEVLRRDRLGVHDNVFELGAHSLLITQVASRVRETLRIDLPLRELFEAPTVAELAARVALPRPAGQPAEVPALTPVPRGGSLPLSFGQERMWFLYQLEPDRPVYNLPSRFRQRGVLDLPALAGGFGEIVRRHEVLRTRFASVDGEVTLLIDPAAPLPLPVVDLQELPDELREAEARRLAVAEARRPFVLEGEPPFRVGLLRLAADDHVVLATMHHIAGDGWSAGILLRELIALYAALSSGGPPSLPELPLQYADFAAWQRSWLRGEWLASEVDHWRRTLAGLPPVLALPTDRPRPAVQSYLGDTAHFALPTALVDDLVAVCGRCGVTPFMLLLAAYQAFLSRLTRQPELAVGTPTAGRDRLEIEGLIGFFVNTLAIRGDLRGDPTFAQLLDRTRDAALTAYAHQAVPFDLLVGELQPERSLSYSPLFQTMLALQEPFSSEGALAGLVSAPFDTGAGTGIAKVELTLMVTLAGGLGRCVLEYSSDLFDRTTGLRLAEHFRTLLESLVKDPGIAIGAAPLLDGPQCWQILREWNDSAAAAGLDRGFPQEFELQAARTPHAVAVTCGPVSLTYEQLDRRSNRLARALLSRGAGGENVVALLGERNADFLTAVLAILKAGAAYLPLDPESPAQRWGQILSQSACSLAVVTGELAPAWPGAVAGLPPAMRPRLLLLEDLLERHPSDGSLGARCEPQSLAYVLFTSGSTGTPKGAMIEHRGMLNHLHAKIGDLRLTAADCVAQTAPQSFDISVWQLLAALLAGGRVHIVARATSLDPERLIAELEAAAVSVFQTVPSMLRAMLRDAGLGERRPQALRWMIATGEALPPDLAREWLESFPEVPLLNAYGPTECSDDVTHACVAAVAADEAQVPIGRPILNTQIHVLDDSLSPLPVGAAGELYVGGAGVGRGYLHRPDLTAEHFVPDPFGASGSRLYRVGDLARWRADGALDFLGRVDHQVKVRGFRIELGEIETVLRAHPAVEDAAVLAREDGAGYSRLVAYVVQDPAGELADEGAATSDRDRVEQWKAVFDEVYRQGDSAAADAGVNLRVWVDSYTGEPLPEQEILECVEDSVSRILRLQPERVLEIGCGTGLLLTRIAPFCGSYWATDISGEVLAALAKQVAERELPDVRLFERAAHDLHGIPARSFDTVILNEVVQYFPDADYLIRVLEEAVEKVRPGGRLFVGGVRNRALFEAFHASVQLRQAADSLPLEELRRRVRSHMSREKELLVAPELWSELRHHLPRIGGLRIELKGGRAHNELTRFRYDVTLGIETDGPAAAEPAWREWAKEGLSMASLRRLLSEERPERLGVLGVPNARLRSESLLLERLRKGAGAASVGELRRELDEELRSSTVVDPADVWRLAEEFSYGVEVRWSVQGPDRFDAVFRPLEEREADAVSASPPRGYKRHGWSDYTNNPFQGLFVDTLAPRLRGFLAERLPDYMIPSSFVFLEALPLTPNGKLDRRALPEPEAESAARPTAPRTPIEDLVAQIWAQVLGRERVGVEEDFFALGGHSLLATRVMSRLRSVLHVELPLRALFEAPTVAGLAAAAERARRTEGALERPPLIRVARDGELPLSYAQQRLWFLDQFEPDSPLYNLAFPVRLAGELDVRALRRSLEAIVARHEVLRTRFPAKAGRPVQEIEPADRWLLPVVDLTGLDEDARRRELRDLAQADWARPFDLARGPVFRTSLLSLTQWEHVLLATVHHIASDGWSTGVLRRELGHFYGALSRGEEAALPELPVQYADYAVWQRGWLEGGGLEAELAHWRRRLEGAPEVTELPTDRPRPAVRTVRGASRPFTLSASLWEALRSLGRQQGATPFMALLAGFQALLGRYTGADVVVGTPVAGRQQLELEGLIGFFVNTLVLRVGLAGDPSFSGVVERVREAVLDAHEHQDLPFDRLVEELHPHRSLSYSPLFQILFVYQPQEAEAADLPGLRALPMPDELRIETARFDLTLVLTERADTVGGFLNYSTDLFEAPTIARLLEHLQALLESAAADPRQRLADLPLLSAAERQALTVEWTATSSPRRTGVCLHELIGEQAERSPRAVAVELGDESLSYGELWERAGALARHLRFLGVGPEARVGIFAEPSLALPVALLAVLRAGGAYVPLDPSYPSERLSFMVEDAGMAVVLCQEHLLSILPPHRARVVVLDEEIASGGEEDLPQAAADHLAYVIYTSGSTGMPKGVLLTHANFFHSTAARFEIYPEPVEALLVLGSFAFDASVAGIFWTLCQGGRLVLAHLREDLLGLPRLIARTSVSYLVATTPLYSLLLDEAASTDLDGVRQVIVGGEACPADLVKRHAARLPHAVLCNEYGPTEGTVWCTVHRCRAGQDTVPIGYPIPGARILVLDGLLEPRPAGVAGELWIGGLGLARGYHRRPALTAERFIPDPYAGAIGSPGARLYRTGDLARWLPDGKLEFLGRIDQQVKLRGFRIELGEIEAALAKLDWVQEAAVSVREDGGTARLAAYVAPREGTQVPAASELRTVLSRTLPDYMVPAHFVMLERLPRLANGKVDRKALPAPAERLQDQVYTPPRNSVEEKLAALWAEVLRVGRVGVHDNFFELGGDSILSIQIVARAGEAGLFLTPRQIFQHQTVAELAAEVQMAPAAPAEQGPVTGPVPLTPIQRWFFAAGFAASHHFNQAVLLQARRPLEVAWVARVFAGMIRHHDALRMRFARAGQGWWQANAGLESVAPFLHLDLSALPVARRTPALEAAAAAAQASLDLEHGPLVRALWFDLGAAIPARLLLLAHHLVVDGVSWRILLDDLVRGYQQLAAGGDLRFPSKTTSFKEWAERLEDYARSAELAAEREQWLAAASAGSALPVDFPGGANLQAAARTVAVALEPDETRALLQEVPAAYRTQINDVLLTALVETFAAWTGEPSLVIDLEAHGREELFPGVDLSRTVGWFTSQYPVRLSLHSPAVPGAALKRIKEELRAVRHNGIGYGLLRWMAGDPALSGALAAAVGQQVAFNYLGQLDQALPESPLFAGAAESPGPAMAAGTHRPAVLDISASVRGERLRIQWQYSRELHREETVRALAEGYRSALRRLIEHCRTTSGGLTPSDLPLLRLDQEALDRLFTEPRSIEDTYPLSPLQQGMLLHSLGAPGSGIYVEQLSCRLEGDLDAAALERACGDVVARHPVLRTAFLWDGLAEPIQVVHRQVDLPLHRLSWTGLPADEQERRLSELLRDDRRRGFDLARPPLLRATLIELDPGSHRFLWTTHHLVGDGWSGPVMVRELLAFYEGRRRGTAVAMEQARPFRDYIDWIARQDTAATEAFWRRELAGFTAPTPLGVDTPGERRELGHGDERTRLSREATAALEDLARGSKLTLNTMAQGAWALLLARYSGEEDVLFGITVAGRPASLRGAETMVGPFISTLPLRVKVPAKAPLLPWLEELQRRGLERQNHEYSSFVQPWSEVPMGLPLFETLLVFENYPRSPASEVARRPDAAARPALEARDLRSLVRTRYAINMVVNPSAELQLYLSYDRSRLDVAAARRMQDHLANLLAALAADPSRTLAELPMLADAERWQLVAERAEAGDLLVLGPDLRPSPFEVPGEVHIGLPAVAAPELATAPWNPALALLPTGEWARRLTDGQLRLLGRRTERVLVHGRAVWLREVEEVVARHLGVREAVVALEEGALAAWIVPAAADLPAASGLRAFAAERLPRHMVPRSFLPLPDPPRTAAGGIDRASLGLREASAGAGERDASQLTDLLLGLWSEVLGIDALRAQDSFLDLGGSSLVASRLVSRLRTALGIEVPLRVLFEAPTAAELARWIERSGAAAPPGPPLEPVPRDRPLPLSFAQQRLWFLDQLAPGDVSYNVPVPVRLSGDLNAAALDLAFDEVVRRHEALRTTFPDQEGRPAQRFSPPWASRLSVADLGGLPAARRESEARRLAEVDACTPFDLARGPLLRTVLVRLDVAEHVLLFSTHHIVSDAWSIAVLVREIGILYQAYSARRPSPLPELPVQYADYADWQRRWLDGEALDTHLAYWRRHLGGTPPVLDLAADRPRPERPSGRGRQRVFTLPADLSQAVVALGRREGTTPFMTLLAAFAALLGRVSGSGEVVLGMPIAGRSRLETEGMIGFFVNILPLRLDLSQNPTFRELLRQAREATLGAFAHQEIPLEKLVEALGIERRHDRSPLFQVTFGLQNAPEAHADLPGLRLAPLAVENETVRFDLTVWVKETRRGLGVQWTFSTDLFDLSTIERMQGAFEALLAGAVAAPDTEIDRLEMLSAAERETRQRAEVEDEKSRYGRLLSIKPRPVRPVDPEAENAKERTDTL